MWYQSFNSVFVSIFFLNSYICAPYCIVCPSFWFPFMFCLRQMLPYSSINSVAFAPIVATYAPKNAINSSIFQSFSIWMIVNFLPKNWFTTISNYKSKSQPNESTQLFVFLFFVCRKDRSKCHNCRTDKLIWRSWQLKIFIACSLYTHVQRAETTTDRPSNHSKCWNCDMLLLKRGKSQTNQLTFHFRKYKFFFGGMKYLTHLKYSHIPI